MPKLIPPEIKARAVALLCAGESATATKAAIEREFPAQRISISLIARWARALKIPLAVGRPVGTPGSRKQTSPHRADVLRLLAEGTKPAEIARLLGISRQLVHALSRQN